MIGCVWCGSCRCWTAEVLVTSELRRWPSAAASLVQICASCEARETDIRLLRFVDELIALRALFIPHLGDEARLRNIEVPATSIDFLAGLRHRERRPLGHNVEVGGNLEKLIEDEGPVSLMASFIVSTRTV